MNPLTCNAHEYRDWLSKQIPSSWSARPPKCNGDTIVLVAYRWQAPEKRLWYIPTTKRYAVTLGLQFTTPAAAVAAWEMTR